MKARAKEYSLREFGINPNKFSNASIETVRRLKKKGYQAYLVGGAVRDLLLGQDPKDYDVSTDATPIEIKKAFKRAYIIGKRFKLVHVRICGETVEVSTFRKTPRKTKSTRGIRADNTFGNRAEDAMRRDLTVNSLLLDPIDKKILDYTNGIEDIKARTLRVIGQPSMRYREDPVRMMRLLRLSAKLDCKMVPQSLRPVQSMAHMLNDIPPARLFDELTKAIFSKSASKAFDNFLEHGIAEVLFPQLSEFDSNQLSFIDEALKTSDHLLRKNQRSSLSFVISSFFWPVIADEWVAACKKNKANMTMMHDLYFKSGIEQSIIIPRSLRLKVWETWEFQSRFQRLLGRRSALRIDPNADKTWRALLFLRFRNEAGEIGPKLPDWWETFFEMEKAEKDKMVARPKRKNQATSPTSEK